MVYDHDTSMNTIILYGLALFILQIVFDGVMVKGGLTTYLVAGIILTILFFTLKPILQLLDIFKKEMKGGEFMQMEIIDQGAQIADEIELGCCSFDVAYRVPYAADDKD